MATLPYISDSSIMPGLLKLHECLCATLSARNLDPKCECALLHGEGTQPSLPKAGNGYAWVGLNGVFPSKTFPSQDSNSGNCGSPLVASVTMGIMRCYAVKAVGESVENMMLYMDKQMADMAAMRYAIECCAADDELQVSLGAYVPIGPEGGIYGGNWSLSIGQ